MGKRANIEDELRFKIKNKKKMKKALSAPITFGRGWEMGGWRRPPIGSIHAIGANRAANRNRLVPLLRMPLESSIRSNQRISDQPY